MSSFFLQQIIEKTCTVGNDRNNAQSAPDRADNAKHQARRRHAASVSSSLSCAACSQCDNPENQAYNLRENKYPIGGKHIDHYHREQSADHGSGSGALSPYSSAGIRLAVLIRSVLRLLILLLRLFCRRRCAVGRRLCAVIGVVVIIVIPLCRFLIRIKFEGQIELLRCTDSTGGFRGGSQFPAEESARKPPP